MDMLSGYKELRLRQARRDAVAEKVSEQIDDVQRLSMISERHYSYGQVSASGALSLLLIAIVVVIPLVGGADNVTTLQILTLVLFSFGPI